MRPHLKNNLTQGVVNVFGAMIFSHTDVIDVIYTRRNKGI